jgi:hypothetical protein
MQKWEYRFVNTVWEGEAWRVLSVNGKDFGDWEMNETIYEYANRLGDEGSELVAAPYTADGLNNPRPRLIFKRLKLEST